VVLVQEWVVGYVLPRAVQRFQDDDRRYAAWVAQNRAGYVVNIQRSLKPTLHTAPEVDVEQRGYRATVASTEVILEGPRYLPFERLDAEQYQAREWLRSALAGLTAGPEEILHACYSGHKPTNSDVENLVLYNVDPGGASFVGATALGVRFELHSRTADRGSGCRYRYQVIRPEKPLTSWERGPLLARFAGAELGGFRPPHRIAQTWMAVHQAGRDIRHIDGRRSGVRCVSRPRGAPVDWARRAP
jgi:hypothetical protein